MTTQRILQNNRLFWIDVNIKYGDTDTENTIEQLKTIVHHIDLFTEIDDGLRYLQDVKNEHVLIITSGFLGQELIKQIHSLSQVDAIYIFCGNPDRHQSWTTCWPKIRGLYNQINSLCDALRTAVKQTNEGLIPISFINSNVRAEEEFIDDLNQLEPSFMYTTLFKHILLDMEHEPNEKQAIVEFCRAHYVNNRFDLAIVEEFNRDYLPDKAIWWYTRECFTYQMMNRALRLLESDIIVDMGFFIRDLHQQLEQLHHGQFSEYDGPALILYRGQALSIEDFAKFYKNRNGLLAFNSFLSTSTKKSVSFSFARESSLRDNMVGILFVMTIDPTVRSSIFAHIDEYSYFKMENEVLLSMNTVFRIGDILELDERKRLFEVHLTMTSDEDPGLSRLTDRMEKDIVGRTGWAKLGQLLVRMGQLNKAEELFLTLLEHKLSERDQGLYYHQLGLIKNEQGLHDDALKYYERAISIEERILPPTDPLLATSYNNIGAVYENMGEYSKALSYYDKSLSLHEKNLPANHPLLATCYNNIGAVYDKMGKYSQALSYYNKALDMRQITFPVNHPVLATSYNNIGLLYDTMGEHSQALSSYNKALVIRQRTLPDNHPDFSQSYNNIGLVYFHMEQYSQALSFYNRALSVHEKTLPTNQTLLAASYNNIGAVYDSMGEYSQTLFYYDKALIIYEKTLAENHPLLATLYNNMGAVYNLMEEYSKAMMYHKKALTIRENTLPANHSDFWQSYNNIGLVYANTGKNSEALSYYNKAIAVYEKTIPVNNISLATSYNNIGAVYNAMGKYSEALSNHKKALALQEKSHPANHSLLATSYHNIGVIYYSTKEYSQALAYYNRALAIWEKTLPANHSSLATSYTSIGTTYCVMKEYSKAQSYFQKVLEIRKTLLPPDDPNIRDCQKWLKLLDEKLRH